MVCQDYYFGFCLSIDRNLSIRVDKQIDDHIRGFYVNGIDRKLIKIVFHTFWVGPIDRSKFIDMS